MKKKGMIILVLIIVIISVFLYKRWHEKNFPYATGYAKKIGLENYNYTENTIDKLGEPIDIKEEEKTLDGKQLFYMWMTFDGYKLSFYFEGGKPKSLSDYKLGCAWITNPDYKIGRYNIGVGSPRSLVEKAYRGKEIIVDGPFGFIDGIIWVSFLFDSNDKVTEMIFTVVGP